MSPSAKRGTSSQKHVSAAYHQSSTAALALHLPILLHPHGQPVPQLYIRYGYQRQNFSFVAVFFAFDACSIHLRSLP